MRSVVRAAVALVAVAAAVVLLRAQVVETVAIGSDSMTPTLRRGDTALLDKISFRVRDPRRTDLVAFRSPEDGRLTVKRVVGVADDVVELRDAVLFVNGTAVDEPQIDLVADDGTWFGPVTVPAGAVFLMGDNRANSIDSRVYGAVPLADVVGRAHG
jgi:signal peptidase I